jgi:hypothetical protein
MSLNLDLSQANTAAKGNQPLQQTLQAIILKTQQYDAALGIGTIKKVDASTPATSAPPAQSTLTAVGANGNITVSIQLPQQTTGAPQNSSKSVIYQEISTSTVANFTTVQQTYPLTTTTSMTIAAPGQTLWIRLRSTTDQKTFNSYQVVGPIAAGLQTSAASEPATVLNQTNFARVDSVAAGGTATIRVYGSGGVGTSWAYGSGTNSKVIPAGTILNVAYGTGTPSFVAWTGSQYVVKPSLSQVLPDSWLPVGSVSVISNGAGLTLPVIHAVISSGAIIAYNVVSGGNDITGTLTFTITDTGGGTGATVGAATVSGGVLQSLAAGNPGASYTGATVVTPSGGVSGGVAGGGGASGNNGGRLFGLTTNGV